MGFAFGETLLPSVPGDNDKGYWEDVDIVSFNEEILKRCNKEWLSLESVSDNEIETLLKANFQERAISLINKKTNSKQLFGLKDPRITKLFKFWSEVFEKVDIKVSYVLAVRNPISVAHSLYSRQRLNFTHSYLLWTEYYLSALRHLKRYPCVKIEYERLLEEPDKELEKIHKLTNLEINPDALQIFIESYMDKSLEHTHYELKDSDACQEMPSICKDLYRYFSTIDENQLAFYSKDHQKFVRTQNEKLLEMQPIFRLLDQTTNQFEQSRGKAEQARAEAEQARAEAENIKNSRFWKITRPARSLIDLLKKDYN
jgi:hypothetical protein